MDVYCTRCTEPWDNDCIHEEVELRQAKGEEADYYSVLREFQSQGCVAFREFSGSDTRPSWCEPVSNMRAVTIGALTDLLGDDTDGIASMMEDAEYWGLV